MKRLWTFVGRLCFWLSWPALWVYLRLSHRTRVIVTNGDHVLMVRGWLSSGKWSLPGGGLHHGETAADGALRELHEETGLQLKSTQLHQFWQGTIGQFGLHFRVTAFQVTLPEKPLVRPQRFEITALAWLDWHELQIHNTDADAYQLAIAWFERADLLE